MMLACRGHRKEHAGLPPKHNNVGKYNNNIIIIYEILFPTLDMYVYSLAV